MSAGLSAWRPGGGAALLRADASTGRLSLVAHFPAALGVTGEAPGGAAVGVVSAGAAAKDGSAGGQLTVAVVDTATGKELHREAAPGGSPGEGIGLAAGYLAPTKAGEKGKYRCAAQRSGARGSFTGCEVCSALPANIPCDKLASKTDRFDRRPRCLLLIIPSRPSHPAFP